ncbi:MAG TPA: DUF4162 domain-containing protein, partial [Bacteroidia bacterium]|nr:DUF4162 domain-containing protein [Bacteroidia bacterium]
VDGTVKEIKRQHKSNTYELTFKGTMMGFTNAMWAGAELIEHTVDDDLNRVRVKLVGKTSSNDLLQAVIAVAEIHSFREIIPSMNDVFILKVKEEMPLSISDNLTE